MRLPALATAILLGALPAASSAHDHHESAAPAVEAGGAARAAYLFVLDDASKKLLDLAEAIPASSYDWRPAEGVRSVGEAFQHVSGSVYYFTLMLGIQSPAGEPQSFAEAGALEKMTTKAEVQASLAKALAFARQAAVEANPEMLAKQVDFFGTKLDGQTLFLILEAHFNEHLGQLIAYARSNGVVPPWSRGGGN